MMAKATGLSHTAVMRIWYAFGLQPHRAETFKLFRDPLFIETVRDMKCNRRHRAMEFLAFLRTIDQTTPAKLDVHLVGANNRNPKPFIWTKTADQLPESIKRFCMRTSNSGRWYAFLSIPSLNLFHVGVPVPLRRLRNKESGGNARAVAGRNLTMPIA
jgi:hypothetical protein